MRKFFARLMARAAVRLNGPAAGVCRPDGYLVATATCGCGRPDCALPPSVVLTVFVNGRQAELLIDPAAAAEVGRRLVRAGATLQEHHA